MSARLRPLTVPHNCLDRLVTLLIYIQCAAVSLSAASCCAERNSLFLILRLWAVAAILGATLEPFEPPPGPWPAAPETAPAPSAPLPRPAVRWNGQRQCAGTEQSGSSTANGLILQSKHRHSLLHQKHQAIMRTHCELCRPGTVISALALPCAE